LDETLYLTGRLVTRMDQPSPGDSAKLIEVVSRTEIRDAPSEPTPSVVQFMDVSRGGF